MKRMLTSNTDTSAFWVKRREETTHRCLVFLLFFYFIFDGFVSVSFKVKFSFHFCHRQPVLSFCPFICSFFRSQDFLWCGPTARFVSSFDLCRLYFVCINWFAQPSNRNLKDADGNRGVMKSSQTEITHTFTKQQLRSSQTGSSTEYNLWEAGKVCAWNAHEYIQNKHK